MQLYKYRDLKEDYNQAIERLEITLMQQSFWCAQPDKLNDEEEFFWRCDCQPTAETDSLFDTLISTAKKRPSDAKLEMIKLLIDSGMLETRVAQEIDNIIRKCRNEIGLVCFGTSPNNPILWSRYGGNGDGVCIELDVPDQLLSEQLFEVQYRKEKVVHINRLIQAYLQKDTKMIYDLALLTKREKWAPEEEIRFISKKQNVTVQIDGAKVTGLHLGHNLSAKSHEQVKNIVKDLPYELLLHQHPSIFSY